MASYDFVHRSLFLQAIFSWFRKPLSHQRTFKEDLSLCSEDAEGASSFQPEASRQADGVWGQPALMVAVCVAVGCERF